MKKLLFLANLFVVCLLGVVITLQVLRDRQQEVEGVYRSLSRTTAALAEHTQQTLTALDLGLQSIVSELEPTGTTDPAALEEVQSLLRSRQAGSSSTFAFYIFDENARVVGSSREQFPALVLPNNPEFAAQVSGEVEGLYIGPPRVGVADASAEGRWLVNLSRRITNPDGSFGGVVGTNLSLDYLARVYDELVSGAGATVGLVRSDGIILMRSPFDEDIMGRDISESVRFARVRQPPSDNAVSIAYRDNEPERIAVYRFLWGGELLIYADTVESEVLAAWRSRTLVKSGIGLLAYALFAAVSFGAYFYIRRKDKWQKEQARRLRLLADSSAALIDARALDDLLERFVNLVKTLTNAERVEVILEEGPSDLQEDAVKIPILGKDERVLGVALLRYAENTMLGSTDVLEVEQLSNVTGLLLENLQAVAEKEDALQQSRRAQEEIESIFNSISDGFYSLDAAWCFTYLNPEAERLLGKSKEELLGVSIWEVFPELADQSFESEYRKAIDEDKAISFEQYFSPRDIWLSIRLFPHSKGVTSYVQDISEKREMESRLRQSQKMDAIGQLTGGIAHDFNNLLTVILGNADIVEEYLADAPEIIRTQAGVIRRAGERAADLTHRLLAFARRQPLDPRRTNVNTLITDVEEMMRRTLGEHYQIELVRGAGLWQAIVDPHELENAILNLAINARDAMPGGGKLTIETCNSSIDADYAEINEMNPGQYVVVAVSDTGTGMSREVMAKAFDPFFTTKAEGKGSGLGLSMVFGFANQSGGVVKIYSEIDQGTTVKIYLPRAIDNIEQEYKKEDVIDTIKRGTERVLLVEDDDLVLQHTFRSLQSLGYKVTECSSAEQALEHIDNGKEFDMLLTDVVLAGGMSGKQLAVLALSKVPDLKVLFMSGYTENAIVHHGRLDRGVVLLNKPFRLTDLARKVRIVLDS
ncbi:MAG: ATP-binding protein [Pseudohongiellaceae bacterium]|nr:ATP-binding protein [Pseudohongiellaceae bacterium]